MSESKKIIDYVEDYTSTFDISSFNEIDGLVLSELAYLDFSSCNIDILSNNSCTISELNQRIRSDSTIMEYMEEKYQSHLDLLEKAAANPRFKDIQVSNYVRDPVKNNISIPGLEHAIGDLANIEQFSALTFSYTQNSSNCNFVAFTGTNGTTDGWAEDAAMVYSGGTQAQFDSVAYLNYIASIKSGAIDGGGHSKGGNNFEYAYLFCNQDTFERIRHGYIYDSPGLLGEVLANTQRFSDFLNVIDGRFICPKNSVIGQLLSQADNAIFVESESNIFSDHDAFSWVLQNDNGEYSFVETDQSFISRFFDASLDSIVWNLNYLQRAMLFEIVNYILHRNGADNLKGWASMQASDLHPYPSLSQQELNQICDAIFNLLISYYNFVLTGNNVASYEDLEELDRYIMFYLTAFIETLALEWGYVSYVETLILNNDFSTIFDLFFMAMNARPIRYDPLVLDMSGNGFNPTTVEDGANFDLDNNGYAERINWVQGDDVLLAVDKNGDGIINNGSELFEDGMLLNNGQLSRNGFEVLAQYDSNGDGIIDANDVDFSQLLIWNDVNGNGISETGELISLADAGIVSISLNYHTANQNTESGTLLGNVATFTKADGTSFEIAEYWVLSHHYDTIEVTDDTQGLEIPESIAELPNVGCIGNLPSLHRAMLLDDSGRIEALIRRFKNSDDLLARIQMVDELLMILADVENIDPTSRGANFDARKLKILEVAMGENFVGVNGANPNENARTLLNTAYDRLRGAYLSELLIQCGYSMVTNLLFENEDGTINSDLANMFIYYLVSEVKLFGQPLFASMLPHTMELYRNLEFVLGSDNLLQRYREMYETGLPEYATEMNMLLNSYIGTPMNDYLVGNENDNFLSGNDGNDHLEGGAGNDWISGGSGNDVIYGNDGYDMIDGEDGDDIIYGGNGGSEIYGGSGNDQISGGNETDIIYGGDGNDTIHGYAGDDELYGDDGNDSLYGGDGNDTLDGWLGNDILQGGAGNDTYLFGYGYGIDTITDSSGVNKIVFLDDITPADLYIKNEGSNNAVSICIRGTEDRLIINYFKSSAAYQNFTLEFYDGTTMALNDVNSPFVNMNLTDENENISALFAVDSTIHGNGGNDYLYGNVGNDTIFGDDGDDHIYGQSGNDILYGGAGNDHLEGGEGNDTLDGGIGNDSLDGGSGNDTYYFGIGYGTDTINDGSGHNRIVFLGEITPADLYVTREGDYDVAIHIRGTTDKLILRYFRYNASYDDFTLEFSNGTVIAIDSANSPFVNMNMTASDDYAYAEFNVASTIHGNDGDDHLYGKSGDDVLYGDDGNDYLYGNNGDDTLYGGAGNDNLYGYADNDTLYGGAGNDHLEGGEGNDTLDGGIGNDSLDGGSGNDTYYFGIGYGTDTINDGSGINTIVFDGLNKNELSFENGSYNSVIIRVRGTSDCLIISNYRSSEAYRNFNLIFEDCTMSMTDFEVNNDYQYDFTQPSTINDNTGNDTLTLSQNAQEVLFSNLNDNLVISSNSANAALTISDWFDSPNNQIETIISNDGYYIMNTQIALLIDSISQFNSNNNVSWSEALSNNNSQALDIFNQFWVEQN